MTTRVDGKVIKVTVVLDRARCSRELLERKYSNIQGDAVKEGLRVDLILGTLLGFNRSSRRRMRFPRTLEPKLSSHNPGMH